MKRSEAFPSKYLSKDDVLSAPNGEIFGRIKKVVCEQMPQQGDDDEPNNKPILYLEGQVKPMVLNVVNWMTLEDKWGDESDAWTGQHVILFVDKNVMFGGKRVGGVRIRIPAPMPDTGPLPSTPPIPSHHNGNGHHWADNVEHFTSVEAWLKKNLELTLQDALTLLKLKDIHDYQGTANDFVLAVKAAKFAPQDEQEMPF